MNLQTLAHKTKHKPKKAEAQAMIQNIYDGIPATQDELAALYKYFMPAAPAKAKNLMQWVAKARSTEQVRYYLTQCYARDGWLYATDGHRMHWIKTDLPDGYYDDKGISIDMEGTFPDVARIMPDPDKEKRQRIDLDELPVIKRGKIMCYELPIYQGVLHNKRLIDDVMNGDKQADMYYIGPEDPARFEFEDGRNALIMPMRG